MRGVDYERLSSLMWEYRFGDDAWHEEIAQAMLDLDMELVDEDAPVPGSDGLLYFRLRVPKNLGRIVVTLRETLELDPEGTAGVALLDENDDSLYAFSHGDLLSLQLWDRLKLNWPSPWNEPTRFCEKDTQAIAVGAPNRTLLPERVRQALRSLYWSMGILEPKVTAVKLTPNGPTDLVFHAPADAFQGEAHWRWFFETAIPMTLPRHLRTRTARTSAAIPSFPL